MWGEDVRSEERVLIVNADDLGRTIGINQGIFEAHARGIVTSATLMVSYPAAEAAARALHAYPDLGVGLHVQLTGGVPLCEPGRVTSLVGADGRFPAKPEGHGELRLDEVLLEVEAQLARFSLVVGGTPTHLDSHHHSHRLPVVTEALARVAQRIGVPVRRSSEAIAARLAADRIRTTDYFVERFFGADVRLEVLLDILAHVPRGSTELMCHPAVVDPELEASSSYVAERERELELLTDPAVYSALRARGIRLAHFGTW
jgi:predicted glycoside hydrolase/deacetylase ChbG (UPF0249 family)